MFTLRVLLKQLVLIHQFFLGLVTPTILLLLLFLLLGMFISCLLPNGQLLVQKMVLKSCDPLKTFKVNSNHFVNRDFRGGPWLGGTVLLPLSWENNFKGEVAFLNGVSDINQEIGVKTIAKNVVDGNQNPFTYEGPSDSFPYGRIMSNAVLQPNGKILMFNGARLGQTGATAIGAPTQRGAAVDCMLYDPKAPTGKKIQVLQSSPIQRLYHSTALLLPDGTTMIAGTDEAAFDAPGAYEHRVEIYTPPWLMKPNTNPRPVITSAPTEPIQYGSTFTVTYSGTVDRVSIMTPGATTHSVDFTQRLVFPKIESNNGKSLVIRAPPNANVLLQGYHMLFVLTGDVPSQAVWIRFQ
jgi:hypothetical protein